MVRIGITEGESNYIQDPKYIVKTNHEVDVSHKWRFPQNKVEIDSCLCCFLQVNHMDFRLWFSFFSGLRHSNLEILRCRDISPDPTWGTRMMAYPIILTSVLYLYIHLHISVVSRISSEPSTVVPAIYNAIGTTDKKKVNSTLQPFGFSLRAVTCWEKILATSCVSRERMGTTNAEQGLYLEDQSRTCCKWLGSPPFISHKKAIWKGNNPTWGTY